MSLGPDRRDAPDAPAGGARAADPGPTIAVTVAWVTPDCQELVPLSLPAGATAADAVRASGLAARAGAVVLAVHGRRAEPDTPLADGDRVELCGPLVVDPGEARRLRAAAKDRTRDRDLPGRAV